MKKLLQNKWALAAILVALAVAIYAIWRKMRTHEFTNIGDSQWYDTRFNDGKLGLEMAKTTHGLEPGDEIEVIHDSSIVKAGKTTVLDVTEKGGTSVVITDFDIHSNPDITGKVRKLGW
jgi:hypothetical protein